eukprot:6096581-Amphidinium_carterae.2
MPYRSWRPICVKTKGQPTHHKKGALKEQSILQLDYAYIGSNKKWQVHTIVTGVETTTGMCLAILSTSKKGPTKYQLTQIKKLVMENGFGQTIIQLDNEEAILQFAQEAARGDKVLWNDSTRQCLHTAVHYDSTWLTGTTYTHQTMFLNNVFLGFFNMVASQSTDTLHILTG